MLFSRHHAASSSFFDKLQTAHRLRERGLPSEPLPNPSFFRKIKNAFKSTTQKFYLSLRFSLPRHWGSRRRNSRMSRNEKMPMLQNAGTEPAAIQFVSLTLHPNDGLLEKFYVDSAHSPGAAVSQNDKIPIEPASGVTLGTTHVSEVSQNLKKCLNALYRSRSLPGARPSKTLLALDVFKNLITGKPTGLTIWPNFPRTTYEILAFHLARAASRPAPSRALVPLRNQNSTTPSLVVTSEPGLKVDLSQLTALASRKTRPLSDVGYVEYTVRTLEFVRQHSTKALAANSRVSSRVSFAQASSEIVIFDSDDAPAALGTSAPRRPVVVQSILSQKLKLEPLQHTSSTEYNEYFTYAEAEAKLDYLLKDTKFPAVDTQNYKADVSRALGQFGEAFRFLTNTFTQPVMNEYLAYFQQFLSIGSEISRCLAVGHGMAAELDFMSLELHEGYINLSQKRRLFEFGQRIYALDAAENDVRQLIDSLALIYKAKLDIFQSELKQMEGFIKKINSAYSRFLRRHCRCLNAEARKKLSLQLGRDEFLETAFFFKNLNMGSAKGQLSRHYNDLGIAFCRQEELLLLLKEAFIEVCEHTQRK